MLETSISSILILQGIQSPFTTMARTTIRHWSVMYPHMHCKRPLSQLPLGIGEELHPLLLAVRGELLRLPAIPVSSSPLARPALEDVLGREPDPLLRPLLLQMADVVPRKSPKFCRNVLAILRTWIKRLPSRLNPSVPPQLALLPLISACVAGVCHLTDAMMTRTLLELAVPIGKIAFVVKGLVQKSPRDQTTNRLKCGKRTLKLLPACSSWRTKKLQPGATS